MQHPDGLLDDDGAVAVVLQGHKVGRGPGDAHPGVQGLPQGAQGVQGPGAKGREQHRLRGDHPVAEEVQQGKAQLFREPGADHQLRVQVLQFVFQRVAEAAAVGEHGPLHQIGGRPGLFRPVQGEGLRRGGDDPHQVQLRQLRPEVQDGLQVRAPAGDQHRRLRHARPSSSSRRAAAPLRRSRASSRSVAARSAARFTPRAASMMSKSCSGRSSAA